MYSNVLHLKFLVQDMYVTTEKLLFLRIYFLLIYFWDAVSGDGIFSVLSQTILMVNQFASTVSRHYKAIQNRSHYFWSNIRKFNWTMQ